MDETGTMQRVSAEHGASPRHRRRTPARALSEQEREQAAQLAVRLHAALGRLVSGLPAGLRGASAMSRHLDVVRNTCQRLAVVLDERAPDAGTLVRLPGAKGLRLLLGGFAARGADAADLAAAEAAVEQFRQFVKEHAGSQARLARRLEANAPARARGSDRPHVHLAGIEARQHLFTAASEVMGRACELGVTIFAYRIDPTDAARMERAMVTGDFGQTARPSAMPRAIVLGNVKFDEGRTGGLPYESLDHTPAHGRTQHALLEEFCSRPLPKVTSRGSERRLVQVLDRDEESPDRPIDFVVANRSVHDAAFPDGRSALEGVWKLVNYPTRHLVFDVFLHRDMERRFRPGIDVQMWQPNLDMLAADRWVNRFPNGPRLQLLGQGIGHVQTPAYARYAELAATFFARIGWNPEEFVGFRCEVDYPIWRAGYFMTFEEIDPSESR